MRDIAATEIKRAWENCMERAGDSALEAMWSWCNLAEQVQHKRIELLIPLIEKTIVKRDVLIYRAKRRGESDEDAAASAIEYITRVIGTACLIEALAPTAGEAD